MRTAVGVAVVLGALMMLTFTGCPGYVPRKLFLSHLDDPFFQENMRVINDAKRELAGLPPLRERKPRGVGSSHPVSTYMAERALSRARQAIWRAKYR